MKNALPGTFGSIHSRLREHISLSKQAASNDQDTGSESKAPISTSDAEVKDALPSGGQPGSREVGDLTNVGVGAGQSLPGVNTNPPAEEKERKETSPETKLAGIDPSLESLRARLAGNIKLAANHLVAAEAATPTEKTAVEISSLGQAQTPTDSALSASTKADTSTATPVISGVTGISQANPGAGVSDATKQGPEEKSAAVGGIAPADLDAISQKVAQFTHDYSAGRSIAAALLSKMAAPSPEEVDHEKFAAAVENATMISTINAVMDGGVSRGIITPKQAGELAAMAGLRENPLALAIEGVQQKLAELVNSNVGTREQKIAFLEKIADEDPNAATAAAGGQPPMDPEQLKAAIGQLLQELHQAVQSGQMTEEQAMGVLQQLGLPVGGDEGGAPGDAGGAPPDAGGAPGGPPGGGPAVADPQDGGGPSGLPPGGGPPDAGGGPPEKKDEGDKKPEPDKDDSEKKAAYAVHNRMVFGLKLATYMSKKAMGAHPEVMIGGAPSGAMTPLEIGEGASPSAIAPSALLAKAPSMTGAVSASASTPSAAQIADAGASVGGAHMGGGAAAGGAASGGAAHSGGGHNLAYILGGLGLGGLGAMTYKGLSGDEEEKKHKRAEAVDPAMAAAPSPGGDPAAAGGDPAAGGDVSIDQLLQELQQLVASGQIPEEQAQQIVAELQQGGGAPPDAGGGAPPEMGGGAPPVA
jgi:hypothetical protein